MMKTKEVGNSNGMLQAGGGGQLVDEDEDMETQVLDPAAPDHGDGDSDGDSNGNGDVRGRGDGGSDDKDAESSICSSAAETSGGGSANRCSSGGYAGDYSSISEDSSAYRRAERERNANNECHSRKGGLVERVIAHDGGGGDDAGESRICSEDAGIQKNAQNTEGGPLHPPRRVDHATQLLNDPVTGRSHTGGAHHHHNDHQPPRGGANKGRQTNKKKEISAIMNLYSVSLQAVADEYSKHNSAIQHDDHMQIQGNLPNSKIQESHVAVPPSHFAPAPDGSNVCYASLMASCFFSLY